MVGVGIAPTWGVRRNNYGSSQSRRYCGIQKTTSAITIDFVKLQNSFRVNDACCVNNRASPAVMKKLP
jgi:hypothetical protein